MHTLQAAAIILAVLVATLCVLSVARGRVELFGRSVYRAAGDYSGSNFEMHIFVCVCVCVCARAYARLPESGEKVPQPRIGPRSGCHTSRDKMARRRV
jgi:hypothetical protein